MVRTIASSTTILVLNRYWLHKLWCKATILRLSSKRPPRCLTKSAHPLHSPGRATRISLIRSRWAPSHPWAPNTRSLRRRISRWTIKTSCHRWLMRPRQVFKWVITWISQLTQRVAPAKAKLLGTYTRGQVARYHRIPTRWCSWTSLQQHTPLYRRSTARALLRPRSEVRQLWVAWLNRRW